MPSSLQCSGELSRSQLDAVGVGADHPELSFLVALQTKPVPIEDDGALPDGDLREVGMAEHHHHGAVGRSSQPDRGSPPRCSRARRMKAPGSARPGSTKA